MDCTSSRRAEARTSSAAWANAFATRAASFGWFLTLAVTSMMLLWPSGSTFTAFCTSSSVHFGPSFCAASRAASGESKSVVAVWTTRVGSPGVSRSTWIPKKVWSSAGSGLTSTSAFDS